MAKDDDYQQIRRHQKLKKLKCENTGNLLVKFKSGQKDARKPVVYKKHLHLQKSKACRADAVSRRRGLARILAKCVHGDKWVCSKMKFKRNAPAKHEQLQPKGQTAFSMEATSESGILHTPYSGSTKVAQIMQDNTAEDQENNAADNPQCNAVEVAQLASADKTTAQQTDCSTKSLHETSTSCSEILPQGKSKPKAKQPSHLVSRK